MSTGSQYAQHAIDIASQDQARKQRDIDLARQFKINALGSEIQNAQSPEQAQELLTGLINIVQPHEQHHILGALQGLIGKLRGRGGAQQPMGTPPFVDPGMSFGTPPAMAPPVPSTGPVPGTGAASVSLPAGSAPAVPASTPPRAMGPAPGGPQRAIPPGMLNPYANPEEEPPEEAFAFNKPWAKQGMATLPPVPGVPSAIPLGYKTPLSPQDEEQFQKWLKDNKINWQDTPTTDYDMRGYWKALQSGQAKQEFNAWDKSMHYPDRFKTPYSGVFSGESMYASKDAPHWEGNRLVTADGRVVTDETPAPSAPAPGGPARPVPPGMKGKAPKVDPAIAMFGKYWRSPEELALAKGHAKSQGEITALQDEYDWWLKNNPDATHQEKQAMSSRLLGLTETRGTTRKYRSPDGKQQEWYTPGAEPEGWQPVATAAEKGKPLGKPYQYQGKWYQSMQMPDNTVQREEMPEGFTGPPGKDSDQYQAILKKQALGQALTPEEQATKTAYEFYIKKTRIDPRVAGAIALSDNRFVQVTNDPSDPGNVTLMRAVDAARQGVSTPASIAFQTDKAMTRMATSGDIGKNITAFNAATGHLRILKDLAVALNNSDMQMFNSAKNAWKNATGDAVVPEFEAVKQAVVGELTKTFKGASADVTEMEALKKDLSTAQSKEQLEGVIQKYLDLMDSKRDALQEQVDAGKQGKAAFPGWRNAPPAPGGPKRPAPPGAGGGGLSIQRDANGRIIGVN